MLMLNYLYTLGLHNNTFEIEGTRPRINQFRDLICYDHIMDHEHQPVDAEGGEF